jgi:glycosyltransferase involved in cell wall biosynthesis
MRVLFWLRSDAEKIPGGDVTYAGSIAPLLRRRGVKITISSDQDINLSSYDAVHLFNIVNIEETLDQIHKAKTARKPVVIAPEYANLSRFFLHSHWKADVLRRITGEPIAGSIFSVKERLRGTATLKKRIFTESTRIVAKSQRERQELLRDFGVPVGKITVIPNGVSTKPGDAIRFFKKYQVKDFILSVGRIEPIKNQLMLIRATKDLDYPLVLIGAGSSSAPEYEKQCRKEAAGRNVLFIPWLAHERLFDAYKAALVHVAPSYSETFSFTTAEALLSGTQAVVTKESPYREYFGNSVFPCDPYDLSSVRQAIEDALSRPKNLRNVRSRLEVELSWENVARRLTEEYKRL